MLCDCVYYQHHRKTLTAVKLSVYEQIQLAVYSPRYTAVCNVYVTRFMYFFSLSMSFDFCDEISCLDFIVRTQQV